MLIGSRKKFKWYAIYVISKATYCKKLVWLIMSINYLVTLTGI